jgi:hypothetical protein
VYRFTYFVSGHIPGNEPLLSLFLSALFTKITQKADFGKKWILLFEIRPGRPVANSPQAAS